MKDDKLWKAFSEWIRLRDADENGICACITCGVRKHWKQMQAGHGIGRQHWGTRYDERNVNSQCVRCNHWGQGEQAAYAVAVDRKHGEGTWEHLLLKKQFGKRLSDFEIKVLTEHYRKEAKKYEHKKAAN